MFRWLLGLLSITKGKKFTYETTDGFKFFREFEVAKRKDGGWESDENLLCRYIVITKKSPYKGDEDLKQAKALLRKNGIYFFDFDR